MTPERWREVRAAFDRVADLDGAERTEALAGLERDDAELARELRALLAAEAKGLRFPNEPGAGAASERRGERVGAWELLSPLGEGGMGRVYLARRADASFEKLVAIKFIHAELLSPWLRERFADERQALAALEHPGIARLLDGGESAAGEPYLVLEYVEGRPLLEFANERALATRSRIELFLQVLAAVAHAHRHLVVHRDLKPGNILATAEGEAKLLDFGVAKILAPEGTPAAAATRTFLRALTPEYASPEQVLGGMTTTATDVYALGVVLFELLTGRRPYRVPTGSAEDWARAALHQPAERARELGGDLESILEKALRKDPAERYPGADAFADDLKRFLDGRPVAARRGSFAYRSAKFVGRNRAALAATALGLAVLATTLTVTGIRLRRERDRAERRFADTRELARSLLFEIHGAVRDLDGATRARELIVRRALGYLERLAEEAGDDPALVRELASGYEQVAEIQGGIQFGGSLGLVSTAEDSIRRAVSLRDALADAPGAEWSDRLARVRALDRHAALRIGSGRYAEGRSVAERESALAAELLAERPDDEDALDAMAWSYQRLTAAEGAIATPAGILRLERAIALRRRLLAARENDPQRQSRLVLALRSLAACTGGYGERERAVMAEAVGIAERIVTSNPESVVARSDLINTLIIQSAALSGLGPEAALGPLERASELALAAIAIDPANVSLKLLRLGVEGELAWTLQSAGRHELALPHQLSQIQVMEELLRQPEPAIPFHYAVHAYAAWGELELALANRAGIVRAVRHAHLAAAREALIKARDAGAGRLRHPDADDELRDVHARAVEQLAQVERALAHT